MARNQSDIFICKLGNGEYWAYPSPFVAHGGGTEIVFRNLTDNKVDINLGDAPVHEKMLSLNSKGVGQVFVNGDAKPGLYEYSATTEVPMPAKRGASLSASTKVRRIKVKSYSSPKIIIDT